VIVQGGDYPLANIITSEFASTKWRGTMVAAVFSTQALGQFLASLVSLIVIEAFRSQTNNDGNICQDGSCTQTVAAQLAVDRMWRIIIGVGAVPAALALYCRLTIPETPRYTFDVNRDVEQGFADYKGWVHNTIGPRTGQGRVEADRAEVQALLNPEETSGGINADVVPQSSWQDFKRYFRQGSNGWILFGNCGSWFFLDVAYCEFPWKSLAILATIDCPRPALFVGCLQQSRCAGLEQYHLSAEDGIW
jgi:PHS family inorganic phosphate transporter-like MFS transporter